MLKTGFICRFLRGHLWVGLAADLAEHFNAGGATNCIGLTFGPGGIVMIWKAAIYCTVVVRDAALVSQR